MIEFEIVAEPTQSLGPAAPADTRDPGHGGDHQARGGEARSIRWPTSLRCSRVTPTRWPGCRHRRSPARPPTPTCATRPSSARPAPSTTPPRWSRRTCTSPRAGSGSAFTADECVELADFQVIDGQLTNFTVDAHAIAPRLGRTGPVFPVGTGSAQVRAAYHTVSTDELSVFVEVTASTADVFELSAAVYVAPGRHQTPIDTATLDRGAQRHDEGHAHARPAVPRRRPRRHRSLPRVPRRRRPTARRSAPGRTGHAVASRRRFPFNGERKVASTAAGGVRGRGAGSSDEVRLVHHAARADGRRR